MYGLPRVESIIPSGRILRCVRLQGLALAGTLIVGLAAAGCGSSTTSTSSTTGASATSSAKSEFVAKANAICVKSNAVTEAARLKLGFAPNLKRVRLVVRKTISPAIQAEITEIKALPVPSGEQATVTNIVNLAQKGLALLNRAPALFEVGDAFLSFAKVAHPYGLTSCAARP
jgi:hypothetical protein